MLGPEWKYHITIEDVNWAEAQWAEAQEWCEIYIGKFNEYWYKIGIDPMDYIINDRIRTTWYFKREEDVVLFSLRWS